MTAAHQRPDPSPDRTLALRTAARPVRGGIARGRRPLDEPRAAAR